MKPSDLSLQEKDIGSLPLDHQKSLCYYFIKFCFGALFSGSLGIHLAFMLVNLYWSLVVGSKNLLDSV